VVISEAINMASWGATQAKAQFSAVLDKAETEGPQLVRRRKQEFYVVTKEQLQRQRQMASINGTKQSLWDALRCPPHDGEADTEFPRLHSKARSVKF
jgi:hypothetical protein